MWVIKITCKVAFVATIYRHLELFHLPFMNYFQNKGFQVHAYANIDQSKEVLIRNKIICHDLPLQRNPFHFDNIRAFKMLVESFKEERFKLIHVHTPVGSILGRLAAKITNISCVIYTAHGFHFFTGAPILYWILYYPVERWAARLTDYLITINREDYQRAKYFPVRKEVLYIPGVGVDTNQFTNNLEIRKQKRHELGIYENDFVILSVAELNKNKNIIQLIDTISYMKKVFTEEMRTISIKCLLAGEGDQQVKLRKKVKELKLDDQICFLGFRKDVPELMIASDMVVLLSKREGLPKTLMEALAAGKPIVATDVRGNRDLVEDGVNGYLVKVGDVYETAMAFMKLIKDKNMRVKIGENNKEKAKNYDLSKILMQMERVYEKALSN